MKAKKDSSSTLEATTPHVNRFGVVFCCFMGLFCLASIDRMLILNAATIIVLISLALSLGFFYLALYLYQENRPNSQLNYKVHLTGDNYGNIQQGGEGNTQNITRSDKTR